MAEALREHRRLLIELKELAIATQDDVLAVTDAIGGVAQLLRTETEQLGVALAAIKDEIAGLQSTAPALDLSGLQAAVADLNTVASNMATTADAIEAIPPPVATDPTTGAPVGTFPHPAGFNPNDPSIPGPVNAPVEPPAPEPTPAPAPEPVPAPEPAPEPTPTP